ncbi:hypothetical protein [Brachybacterium vulturis]|uniref:hypothetical protein n=1 Tax=Brachybacterium vulturis TaxID=2017484 RepID=UPI0037363D29
MERRPERSDRRRRIGRRIGQVLLALLLVALLIWGLMFLRVYVLLPRTAQREANQGYELMLEEFAQLAAADAEVLDAEFGAPLGTVRTVACSVEPSDRGWFVADHRNDCSLRELEVRAVTGDEQDAVERTVSLLEAEQAWQGDAGYLPAAESSCAPAGDVRIPADDGVPVPQSSTDLAALVVEDLDDLDSCLHDHGPSARTLGAITAQDPRSTVPAAPEDARLLVIVREARISSSSLGCLPLPLFCQPATDQPQLPDAVTG